MPTRSQAHLLRMGRPTSGGVLPGGPPIIGLSPDTASIVGAGALGRVVAAMSITGGTQPVTFTIAAAGGLLINIAGSNVVTTNDPVGTVGAHTMSITALDALGQTKTEDVVVTVT